MRRGAPCNSAATNGGQRRGRLQSLQKYALPWTPLGFIRSTSKPQPSGQAEVLPGRCSIVTSERVPPPISSDACSHRAPFRQQRDKRSRSTSRRRSAAHMGIASDGRQRFVTKSISLTGDNDASSICQNYPMHARGRLRVFVGFA